MNNGKAAYEHLKKANWLYIEQWENGKEISSDMLSDCHRGKWDKLGHYDDVYFLCIKTEYGEEEINFTKGEFEDFAEFLENGKVLLKKWDNETEYIIVPLYSPECFKEYSQPKNAEETIDGEIESAYFSYNVCSEYGEDENAAMIAAEKLKEEINNLSIEEIAERLEEY